MINQTDLYHARVALAEAWSNYYMLEGEDSDAERKARAWVSHCERVVEYLKEREPLFIEPTSDMETAVWISRSKALGFPVRLRA